MISNEVLASQASLANSLLSEYAQPEEAVEEIVETLSSYEIHQNALKLRKAKLENPDLSVDLSFTIGIVGPDDVGKRSLVTRVTGVSVFKKRNIRRKKIMFKPKFYVIDGLTILVNFWIARLFLSILTCLAGDESQRTRTARFLSKTAGNIVMLDVSRPNTVQDAKIWMSELRNHSSNKVSKPTILLGNKMDVDELQRRVPYLSGSDLAYGTTLL